MFSATGRFWRRDPFCISARFWDRRLTGVVRVRAVYDRDLFARAEHGLLRRGVVVSGDFHDRGRHQLHHLAQSHGVEAAFFVANVTTKYLTEIAGLIDGGQLRTRIGAVLPSRMRGKRISGWNAYDLVPKETAVSEQRPKC